MNIFNIIIYLKYVGQTKSVDNASKEVNTKSNNGKSLQQKGDYNCLGGQMEGFGKRDMH